MNNQSSAQLSYSRSKQNQSWRGGGWRRILGRITEKGAEIDNAVKIAPDVGDAEVPGASHRHARDGRNGNDFARIGEPNEPPPSRALNAQPRLLDLGRGLGGEARREFLLESAEIKPGAGHDCNVTRARRSWRSARHG